MFYRKEAQSTSKWEDVQLFTAVCLTCHISNPSLVLPPYNYLKWTRFSAFLSETDARSGNCFVWCLPSGFRSCVFGPSSIGNTVDSGGGGYWLCRDPPTHSRPSPPSLATPPPSCPSTTRPHPFLSRLSIPPLLSVPQPSAFNYRNTCRYTGKSIT